MRKYKGRNETLERISVMKYYWEKRRSILKNRRKERGKNKWINQVLVEMLLLRKIYKYIDRDFS